MPKRKERNKQKLRYGKENTHYYFFDALDLRDCIGESAFQDITPGSSNRSDVERVLGRPLRSINTTVFEYKAPESIGKLEVEHRAGSAVVERIEVYFIKPISRAALIKKLNLQQADATKTNAEGQLVEYFGGSAMLALTYPAGDVSSGVSQMGYYSRQLRASALGIDITGPMRDMQMENEISLDGTNINYYSRSYVEDCKSDYANNVQCKGFTWIKAGTYNPTDPAMCYLLSAVTTKTPARGHISAVKDQPR